MFDSKFITYHYSFTCCCPVLFQAVSFWIYTAVIVFPALKSLSAVLLITSISHWNFKVSFSLKNSQKSQGACSVVCSCWAMFQMRKQLGLHCQDEECSCDRCQNVSISHARFFSALACNIGHSLWFLWGNSVTFPEDLFLLGGWGYVLPWSFLFSCRSYWFTPKRLWIHVASKQFRPTVSVKVLWLVLLQIYQLGFSHIVNKWFSGVISHVVYQYFIGWWMGDIH